MKGYIERLNNIALSGDIYSVYDIRGGSVQELLSEMVSKLNEVIDLTNTSFDYLEWLRGEGLSKQVVSLLEEWIEDGTLQDIINNRIFTDLNTKVDQVQADIRKKFETMINIEQVKGYDPNDISKVLNSIEYKPYTYYYLRTNQTIKNLARCNIELQAGTTLDLDCKIISYSSFMDVSCPNNATSNLKVKYVEHFQKNTNEDYGIKVLKGAKSNFTLGSILHFKKGLVLKPNVDRDTQKQWIQYCNFYIQEIWGREIGLSIEVNDLYSWINENNFYCGGIFGDKYCIYQYKTLNSETTGISLINNNKFYSLGVQSPYDSSGICILIEEGAGETNGYYNIRLHEEQWKVGRKWIVDKGKRNEFTCLTDVMYEGIELGEDSTLTGIIGTGNWDHGTQSFPKIGNKLTGIGIGKTPKVETVPKIIDAQFDSSNLYNLYMPAETVMCNMANGQYGSIYIKEPLHAKGTTFTIRKAGYSTSTVALLLGNKSIVIDSSKGNGLYRVVVISNSYMVVDKISDGDGYTTREV